MVSYSEGKLLILSGIREVGDKVLGLVEGLPKFELYRLSDKIGMGVTCMALILSLIN